MSLELKKDCKSALLVPTSMGIRITPFNGQPVHCGGNFMMHVTSAETNVASVASYLGMPVKVLTTFVKGSPIAQLIKDDLRSRHMDYEGVEVDQGGPWGYRHQINIADSGTAIAPEGQPQINTRFYKGKSAAPDQVGIGLARARAILEKQGGDITVKSKPGRGTEFTIKFYRKAS